MARITLYHDCRYRKSDLHPLTIVVRIGSASSQIATGIKLRDTQWNKEAMIAMRHPDAEQITKYIHSLLNKLHEEILTRDANGTLPPLELSNWTALVKSIIARVPKIFSPVVLPPKPVYAQAEFIDIPAPLPQFVMKSPTESVPGSVAKRGRKPGRTQAKSISSETDSVVASPQNKAKSKKGNFLELYDRYVATKTHHLTAKSYFYTKNKLLDYLGETGLQNLSFDDLSPMWLKEFDAFMTKSVPSANRRAAHMRNLRALCNAALSEEITTKYPFKRFKITQTRTRKRCLTVDELRTLINYPCEAYIKPYRDMFVLMFMLIGINLVDLANLKQIDNDGRVRYRRSKTSKEYSILVHPEARELIERLHGSDHLVHILDRYTNYRNYNGKINNALKDIGEITYAGRGGKKTVKPLFPELSTYWSRHTWATIAASLDIPKETIAAALGHSDRSVTDIYIKFDESKIDAANRKVLDWVLYGKRD